MSGRQQWERRAGGGGGFAAKTDEQGLQQRRGRFCWAETVFKERETLVFAKELLVEFFFNLSLLKDPFLGIL